ncbi:MAG: hypothetical protein LBU94_01840, partial [Clostridiales bacterium]|nr:hypothetical protein [Clostridiales bacterium]
MRINTNIPALQTYNAIRKSNRQVSASMFRMSSGSKINSAKDDAAGLAISTKMRMQIGGLEMASTNSYDGISLVQSADGALQEVHNMIQRLRELAVKSSTDTLENADREKIQEEVDMLLTEIDAISERTEFNTIKLFGTKATKAGGMSFFDGASGISQATKAVSVTDGLPEGSFTYEIASAGTPYTSTFVMDPASDFSDGTQTFTINGKSILFDTDDTATTALGKVKDLAEEMGYTVSTDASSNLVIYSQEALTFETGSKVALSPADGGPVDGAPAVITDAKFVAKGGKEIDVSVTNVSANTFTLELGGVYIGQSATFQVNLDIDTTKTPAEYAVMQINQDPITGKFESSDAITVAADGTIAAPIAQT